ncbi:hypothetical protein M8C21_020158, partial [Ambrosia artemisiifolia]
MGLQSEFEEGEASFQNNSDEDEDDELTIDPDASLSYIGGNQYSVSHSNASQPIRNGPASLSARSGPAPRKSKSNSKLKQEGNTSSGNKSKSVSNFAGDSEQKSLKVRNEVGFDNMLTKRNAEIYSGLGLDLSPSSSSEASPANSECFFHGPEDGPDESPTSILEMMTAFPVSGSLLLSPLPDDVLHLTDKKPDDNNCGPKRSQESIVTAVHGSDLVKVDQNIVGEKSRSTEKNSVSVESTTDVLRKKETSVDNSVPANKASSSGGKRKAEGGLKNESFTSKAKKNDKGSKSHTEDFKNDGGKVKEAYKDFFGELDIEQEHDDEMGSEKPLEGINVKGTTLENDSLLKERLNGKKNKKLSEPTMGNGLEFDVAAHTVVPVVNEDWVCCDKCEKWRLLPPGQNPGSLPEKWICDMLDWLPGMNRCSTSEEETTKAITSRFPGPIQGSQPVHPVGPHLGVISLDGTHQHFGSEIRSSSVKKKHGLEDLTNEAKRDRPSLSSNSSKKKLHSSYKTRSVNGMNRSSAVTEVEFQDSGQSRDVIVEKDILKPEEDNKICKNFADEGNIIHHPKIGNKGDSTRDFSKMSKKED